MSCLGIHLFIFIVRVHIAIKMHCVATCLAEIPGGHYVFCLSNLLFHSSCNATDSTINNKAICKPNTSQIPSVIDVNAAISF